MKKPKTTTEKPVLKTKAEQPISTVAAKAMPKNSGPDQKTPKKAQTVAPKPVEETPELTMADRVGLTAGSIWHYLAEYGATSVAKLIRELPEDEKTIHRSIGWLAQEDKITLKIIDRAETLSLKE